MEKALYKCTTLLYFKFSEPVNRETTGEFFHNVAKTQVLFTQHQREVCEAEYIIVESLSNKDGNVNENVTKQ